MLWITEGLSEAQDGPAPLSSYLVSQQSSAVVVSAIPSMGSYSRKALEIKL